MQHCLLQSVISRPAKLAAVERRTDSSTQVSREKGPGSPASAARDRIYRKSRGRIAPISGSRDAPAPKSRRLPAADQNSPVFFLKLEGCVPLQRSW